ncbi:hypothetical protein NJ76_11765, partial [Rhodococcus sp. IITR03]
RTAATAPTVANVLGIPAEGPAAEIPLTELTAESAQQVVQALPAPFDSLSPERITRIVEASGTRTRSSRRIVPRSTTVT